MEGGIIPPPNLAHPPNQLANCAQDIDITVGDAGYASRFAKSNCQSETPKHYSRFSSNLKEKRKSRYWIFGLPRNQNTTGDQVLGQDDYEQKYPPDAYCDELGPNARIYKVYTDEAAKHDDEAVDSWRDSLDVLLVFAGLFSAVVTTCVVESSTKLDIDWSEMNTHLLAESNAIQRALAAGSSLDVVPISAMSPTMNFIPKTTDRWTNGLWFVSLSFSLATALFAVLVKQWLKHYRSTIAGSARDRAHIMQSRREALERWRVPTVVGLLPLLLHISLFMFFAGLAVFLYPLDQTSFRVVTGILAISLIAYVITNLLPLFFPQCSYVTPLTSVVYATIQSLRIQVAYIRPTIRLLKLRVVSRLFPNFHRYYNLAEDRCRVQKVFDELRRTRFRHISELERGSVAADTALWDAQVLVWLQATTSLHPTVSPVLLQAIAGLPIDYPDTLFQTLVQANIHCSYPIQAKPWMGPLVSEEHQDPRQFYHEKDSSTVERYIRACIQFNARLSDDRVLSDDKFNWTHGSLLLSLPCFYNAWESMTQYGEECEHIRQVCSMPWQNAEQSDYQSPGTSRFALIFVAFLRLQASASVNDAERLHPIIWEQLLLYLINFLTPQFPPSLGRRMVAATDHLTEEEKIFIKRSGQDIFSMMLIDRHADERNLSVPIFALPCPLQDTGTREPKRSEINKHSTTILQLPRRYFLHRFLLLSTGLGCSPRQSLSIMQHPLHPVLPTETELIQRLPEYYIISLTQLLDYAPFVQTDSGSDAWTTEMLDCTSYLMALFRGLQPGSVDYTTTEAEYMRSLSPTAARTWLPARHRTYVTTLTFVQERISSFICDGEYQIFHGEVKRRFIRALSQIEVCLRASDPNGPLLPFSPMLLRQLLKAMFLIPTLKHRTINIDNIWVENSVFYLLWRSLKDGNPTAFDIFVESSGVEIIANGLRAAKEQTSWNDTQFEYYALSVAVVLLGFIQGFLERRRSQLALDYVSSPFIFSTLCNILFSSFLAHPSYRNKIEPYFLSKNLDLWDIFLALARLDIAAFRGAWKEVFQRKITLTDPTSQRDYVRVQELKNILGLEEDPDCKQSYVMRTTGVSTELEGKRQPLTPAHTSVDQTMNLSTVYSIPNLPRRDQDDIPRVSQLG